MKTAYWDYVYIGGLSFLFMVLFLGDSRALSLPDEGRYVGIAVEMLRNNDWVVPRLNGVQYLYKPPLFYWLNALSIALFDNVVWASRFVPMFISWSTIMMTLWFGRRFFNRTVGNVAAVFLSLSFMWYVGGRSINLDMTVAAFMVMAFYMYFSAVYEKNPSRQAVFAYAMYIFIAAAVLTKGFMGIVLTGGVFFVHVLCTNGWKSLLKMRLISGIILVLVLVLPWHILMYQANPQWFDFYIIREHFSRFFTTVHNRYQPWWYFIPYLAIGLMPYGAYVVQPLLRWRLAWAETTQGNSVRLYLLIWVWGILLFFSVSSSKLPLYVLPILPAICILSAQFVYDALQGKHYRCISISAGVYMIFTAIIGGYSIYIAFDPTVVAERDVTGVHSAIKQVAPLIFAVGLALMLHGSIHFIAFRKRQVLRAIVLCGIVYTPVAILINSIVGATNKKSTADITAVLQQQYRGEEIILWRFYEDVPVFMNTWVSVVDYSGESQYFMDYEDISDRYYTRTEFKNRWLGSDKKYLILNKYTHMPFMQDFPYKVVAESHLYYLLTNK